MNLGWIPKCLVVLRYLNSSSHEALLCSRQVGQCRGKVVHTWRRETWSWRRVWVCHVFHVSVYLQPHQLWVEMHMGSSVCRPQVVAPVGSPRRPARSTHCASACVLIVAAGWQLLGVTLIQFRCTHSFIFEEEAIYLKFSSMRAAVADPTKDCLWH